MIDKFRLGVNELMDVWNRLLPDESVKFLYKAKRLSKKDSGFLMKYGQKLFIALQSPRIKR